MGRGKLKKFKFALQSLLDLRAKRLEELQIEFGKLQFIMRSLENELSNMEDNLNRSKENLAYLISNSRNIDVSLIKVNQCHIAKTIENITVQNTKIEEHKKVLEAKQAEMLEALKDKTMLEKLKEKQYKAFLKAVDDVEKKELDEIGLMRCAK